MNQFNEPSRSRRAFTLIELLIVVGIITLLIALGLSVAGKVSGTGKVAATKDILKVLDQALTAYTENKGADPLPWVVDPRPSNTNGKMIMPVADAQNLSGSGDPINSVGLFIEQCKAVPAAYKMIQGVDAKFVKVLDVDGAGSPTDYTNQGELTTIIDGWGHPIRYVHPFFKGILPDPTSGNPPGGVDLSSPNPILTTPPGKQWGISIISRHTLLNEKGSDGGLNPSPRPYFYSAGPDGDPTTTDDNIYLVTPRFKKS